MKVAILDDWFDTLRGLPSFAKLAAHDVTVWTDHTDDVGLLAERLAETEALVLIRERTAIRADLVARLPNLRLISQRSVYPHIDVAACTGAGVMISSDQHDGTPSYAAAEMTWALLLAVARQIPKQVAALKGGTWQAAVGTTLRGKILGIYGYGRIARVVAGYARAFGMEVLVWARAESRERAASDGLGVAPDKDTFLKTVDVLSLHMRLKPATRGILTRDDLALMKPSAILINTARAGLIAPGALADALKAGRPGWAGVDVLDIEPVGPEREPLLSLPNALCTPHVGYVTREEFDLQFSDVYDQINAFAAGAPSNVVNPEVLKP